MPSRTLSAPRSFSTLTETLKKEIEDSKVFLRKTFEKHLKNKRQLCIGKWGNIFQFI